MKHCLIFDLDGTLVDSLPGIAASLNRTLTAHGLPGHSDTAVQSFVGDGLRMLVQRGAPQGADPSLIDSLVSFFKKDYDASWASGTQAYPGVHHMLEEFQKAGFQMAVLSNKTHDFTVAMVQALFPQIHFAAILGQREGFAYKPHPAGAFLLATTMGTDPENCVMIGDSTIDMQTAANAAMKSIAVTWGYHDRIRLQAAGAQQFAEHPAELVGLVG